MTRDEIISELKAEAEQRDEAKLAVAARRACWVDCWIVCSSSCGGRLVHVALRRGGVDGESTVIGFGTARKFAKALQRADASVTA